MDNRASAVATGDMELRALVAWEWSDLGAAYATLTTDIMLPEDDDGTLAGSLPAAQTLPEMGLARESMMANGLDDRSVHPPDTRTIAPPWE